MGAYDFFYLEIHFVDGFLVILVELVGFVESWDVLAVMVFLLFG